MAIVVHEVKSYAEKQAQKQKGLFRQRVVNLEENPMGLLEERLTQAGLVFATRECAEKEKVVFLVRATKQRLEQEKEAAHIEQQEQSEGSVETDNILKLTTAERIELTHRILTFEEGNGPVETRNSDYAGVLDPGLISDPADAQHLFSPWVVSVLPVHDRKWNEQFLKALSESSYLNFPDPLLNSLRDHFGEETTWYTAWMKSYIGFLALLSCIGVFVQALSFTKAVVVLVPLYAILVEVLAILFLRAWERRYAGLQFNWNVEHVKLSQKFRTQFVSDHSVMNPMTGQEEPHYSWYKRAAKQLITVLIVIVQLVVLTAIIGLFFAIYVSAYEPECLDPKYQFPVIMLISVVWGLSIEAVNYTLFATLAEKLTGWENYKFQFEHQQQFIFKVFVFFFMDNYLWYFLLTLVWIPQLIYTDGAHAPPMMGLIPWCPSVDQLHLDDKAPVWIGRVSSALFFYLFTTQLLLLLLEDYVPYLISLCRSQRSVSSGIGSIAKVVVKGSKTLTGGVMAEVKRIAAKSKRAKDGESELVQAAVTEWQRIAEQLESAVEALSEDELTDIVNQADMESYSTFYDWADMTSQYGYILFFSIVCPLAAFVCLINNMLEIRGDLFKVCHNLQRAVPSKTSTIGSWMEIQNVMSYLSALIASAVLVLGTSFADRWFARTLDIDVLPVPLDPSFKIYLMVVLEHFVLMLMYLAKSSVGRNPRWVQHVKSMRGKLSSGHSHAVTTQEQ